MKNVIFMRDSFLFILDLFLLTGMTIAVFMLCLLVGRVFLDEDYIFVFSSNNGRCDFHNHSVSIKKETDSC